MKRPASTPEAEQILAAVDSETRPYTDPGARYPRAENYRTTVIQGAARRRPAA